MNRPLTAADLLKLLVTFEVDVSGSNVDLVASATEKGGELAAIAHLYIALKKDAKYLIRYEIQEAEKCSQFSLPKRELFSQAALLHQASEFAGIIVDHIESSLKKVLSEREA